MLRALFRHLDLVLRLRVVTTCCHVVTRCQAGCGCRMDEVIRPSESMGGEGLRGVAAGGKQRQGCGNGCVGQTANVSYLRVCDVSLVSFLMKYDNGLYFWKPHFLSTAPYPSDSPHGRGAWTSLPFCSPWFLLMEVGCSPWSGVCDRLELRWCDCTRVKSATLQKVDGGGRLMVGCLAAK